MKQPIQPFRLSLKPRFLRVLLRGLQLCMMLYLLICVGCGSFQRRMIYYPPKFTSQKVDELAGPAGLERWKNSLGESIGMKRLSPQQPATGQILIVYGNGGCATCCSRYADAIQKIAAFDVFILEYPGYADRTGSPSQDSFFRSADEAIQSVPTNAPVYLLGESLGTGVASYLAGTNPGKVAGVVLLSPYNRLTDVAQYHMPILPVHLILVDRFPSQDYLRNYHGPVGIMVDGKDQIVPEKFGLRLYDGYVGPKRLWEFPDGGHVSITEQPTIFWKEVVDFWQTNSLRAAQTNAPIAPLN
jgi:uncharacterized protein